MSSHGSAVHGELPTLWLGSFVGRPLRPRRALSPPGRLIDVASSSWRRETPPQPTGLPHIALILSAALLIAATPAERGRNIFDHQCAKCHALDENREGPRLRGVYGKPAASAPSFNYSDALKNSHITWNDQTLDQWLTDPSRLVPESFMAFHLTDAGARKAVIEYLRQLSQP